MSTDIKLSRAQICTIIQAGGFLGSLLSKLAGPLMKVAVPLAKNVLAPLGITVLLLQQFMKEFKRKYMVLEQQVQMKNRMTFYDLFKLLKILIFY